MSDEKQIPSIKDFEELMLGLPKQKINSEPFDTTPTPMDGIKLKVKEGWMYRIGIFPRTAYTGYGGAINFVDIGRNMKMSDEEIGQKIFLCTDAGDIPLNDITWNKIPTKEQPCNDNQ